ncbi:MAG: hypothetical protein JSV97_10820 [candidate division WOR-3 bacterium]|nr:MAG: hypothetical protein JSV97_10820 [candidate division WOR-3 bacterium]
MKKLICIPGTWLIILSILLLSISCKSAKEHEAPDDGFFEGTPEDSAAIMDILNNDYPELLITDEVFNDSLNAVALAAIEILQSELYFLADSPLIKQHVDSCGLGLMDAPLEHYWDLWYAMDTTCVVFLRDMFNFYSLTHADVKIIAHYDSMVIIEDDTSWMIGTVDTIIESYYAPERAFIGQGRRVMFFDVIREMEIDPETGDTVWAVVEPREWILKRVLYGTYYFPTAADDVPSIDRIILTRSTGVIDTIFSSVYDPDYNGHVMDRFRAIDSLLVYDNGDLLTVTVQLGGQVSAADCVFFVTVGDSARVNIVTAGNQIEVIGDGIANLYFEVVETSVYYYVNPEKDYKATMWLIPVRINTGSE